MDGLLNKGKDLMSNMGNNSGNNSGNQAGADPNAQQGGNAGAGQEDYGDKGLDFLEKKTGHTLSRDQNEKITDGVRNFYEKETGSKVNSKFSN